MTDSKSEMHELGNALVALQFCLRQLGGRQRTDELEGVVRTLPAIRKLFGVQGNIEVYAADFVQLVAH